MPRSAVPKHVLDRDWKGTDNDSWFMRLKKRVQYIFAAGPNVPSGLWKWRETPITLLGYFCHGRLRLENTDGSYVVDERVGLWHWKDDLREVSCPLYVSRIQPWARWGIVLQWPLFFNCWFIYRNRDVVSPPRYKSEFGIKTMVTFHIGYKRDGDRVYWPTLFLGGNFE